VSDYGGNLVDGFESCEISGLVTVLIIVLILVVVMARNWFIAGN
jgi:hypothetical protein